MNASHRIEESPTRFKRLFRSACSNTNASVHIEKNPLNAMRGEIASATWRLLFTPSNM